MINHYFEKDKTLSDIMPISSKNESIFELVGDGILLCKMINRAHPGTIFEKAINTKKPLNVF